MPSHTGPLDPTTPITNIYSNNRIVGGSYDLSGNQSSVNGNTIYYYPEGRPGSVVDGVSRATTYYNYDGLGNRVVKGAFNGGTSLGATIYVYDANNLLAAEYSDVPQSASPCLMCFLTADHLGSTRRVTDATGKIIARHDYAPFGEEVTGRGAGWGSGTDNINQKFTGQEHDTETGMDFFQARYYGSALGRFTSPDPWNAGADPMNPQSWNMYAYVYNNPLNATDPSGMYRCDPWTGCGPPCFMCGGDGGGGGNIGDDPCGGDPFCGDGPPPIFGGPGGGGNGNKKGSGGDSASSPPSEPLPPGSFPGGESLGLPAGLRLPAPWNLMPNPWILSMCPTADPKCVEAQIALFSGIDLINQIWLLRVSLGTLIKSKAAPLLSSSSACQGYGKELYLGVSLQCFCSSAGDSAWSQQVRGCLASEHQYGTNPFVAHGVCYKGGGLNAPVGTLIRSYRACMH